MLTKRTKGKIRQPESAKEQIRGLTCELLKERIVRIDLQVQLLTEWRQRCHQELVQLSTAPETL